MTVKINDINSNFTNPSAGYTALAMSITDVASGANSLIMHISVNGDTRFAIDKTGTTTIKANVDYITNYPYANNAGSNEVLSVYSNRSDLMFITPEGSYFRRPVWVQSYGEGHVDISDQGENVLIDLSNGSFFTTNTANINTFNIKFPNIQEWGAWWNIWTFSLLIKGPCDLNPDMWWDSGHYYPNYDNHPETGYDYMWLEGGPPTHVETDTIITIQYGDQYTSFGNIKWLGVTSGLNYLPVNA